jgi:glucose-1-phosphatase
MGTPQNIKHIIFDLGNVILNIDYQATITAFQQLGITNFKDIFSKDKQNTLSDDFETGKVSEQEYLNYLLSLCQPGTTFNQVKEAWNAIILNFPLRRLQLLQQLQIYYDLFLLSNTNITHEQHYNQLLQQTCGYNSLALFFDKIYLSHHIGLRKPDPKAWQLILEQNNLEPQHTLFLDDSIQHIEAAKKLNINCIHITPQLSMEDVFKNKI